MTDFQLDSDYRSLINKMAAQRAIERFLLCFIALGVVGALMLLFFDNSQLHTQTKELAVEIHNQQTASASRAKTIEALENEVKTATQQNEKFTLCLGEFFELPDRNNLTITSLQACSINPNSFTPSSNTSNGQPPTANNIKPTSSTSTPVTTVKPTTTPTTPATTTSSPPPSTPPKTSVISKLVKSVPNLF